MITVAGVTFSITMVAVTQASSQYTPRILRNFMRDHANQVVLGVFVDAYTLSSYRTVEQDPAFGVRQLVDIALKALSPGVNDTTTAVSCVHYLGAILVRLADTRVEDPFRATDGAVRIIARGPTFESMLRESLDQIRQNADANVGVLARVFGTIATLAKCTHAPDRRALLSEQIGLFLEVVESSVKSSYDRELLQDLARDAVAANTSDRR